MRPGRGPIVVLAILVGGALLGGAGELRADPPPGYYDPALGLTGASLKQALHAIIDDHTRLPYTSSSTDTWDVLALAHADPALPTNVLTVYRNKTVDADDHSQATGWNREHTWPSSYGFTDDGPCNYPYTDLHQLMPADWGYNAARSNRPYDSCLAGCELWPVDGFPTENNLGDGFGPNGSWQTWSEKRGDVARALFYLAVRYEGGIHAITGCDEPDLILTNDRSLIVSNTSSNYSPAYMGVLDTLLDWHAADPVDPFEEDKNDVIFGFQGNRNPFIDHPEWVCQIWGVCSDTTPPAVPTGLLAIPGDCSVTLAWAVNTEPDLAGYDVFRSNGGGPLVQVNPSLVMTPTFTDTTAVNGVLFSYEVRAVDLSGNASANSTPALATPNGSGPCSSPPAPWINEIHYDNSGGDTGEGFEIAGPAGLSLSGWSVVLYNGASDLVYDTVPLTGTLPDQQGGFGTLWYPVVGVQNGAPDGLALVDDVGAVLEFLSYEGTLTALDGPAAGQTSIDIGVAESSATAIGTSIQRVGIGTSPDDFTWSAGIVATEGLPNLGQTFGGSGSGFLRGDANVDAILDISDAVTALQTLFGGATALCLDAIDANDDGAADIGDPVYLLGYTFSGGAPPPPPFPLCGDDPTADPLDCATGGGCP